MRLDDMKKILYLSLFSVAVLLLAASAVWAGSYICPSPAAERVGNCGVCRAAFDSCDRAAAGQTCHAEYHCNDASWNCDDSHYSHHAAKRHCRERGHMGHGRRHCR